MKGWGREGMLVLLKVERVLPVNPSCPDGPNPDRIGGIGGIGESADAIERVRDLIRLLDGFVGWEITGKLRSSRHDRTTVPCP